MTSQKLLRILKESYGATLPSIVMVGEQQAKNIYYKQLLHLKYWESLVGLPAETHIFPLLPLHRHKYHNERRAATARLANAYGLPQFNHTFFISRINSQLTGKLDAPLMWWTAQLAGVFRQNIIQLLDLEAYLSQKQAKIIFLVDGDFFSEDKYREVQRVSLRGLIDLQAHLDEIKSSRMGLILFIRQETLESLFPQDLARIEARYGKYRIPTVDPRLEGLYDDLWYFQKQAEELKDINKAIASTLQKINALSAD